MVMKRKPRRKLPAVKGDAPLSRNIGRCIHDRRVRLQMSLEALSDETGVSRTEIYYVETGQRNPGLEMIEHLSPGVRATPLELLAEADGRSRRET